MRIDIEHPLGGNQRENGLFTNNIRAELHIGDEATLSVPRIGQTGKKKLPGTTDGVETSSRKSLEPHEMMEFESKEDAFGFYKEYAISIGFSAILKASRRSRISGKFIDAKFVCTRYGSKKGTCSSENTQITDVTSSIPVKKKRGRINRSWSKTDCKACMHVKRRQDGKWIIISFIKEHNHDLVLEQAGLRDIDVGKHNVSSPNTFRVRKKNMCMSMFGQSGQMQKTEHQDKTASCSNGLPLGFREGDAEIMLEYFSCMQEENPYFFYALDLNREQQLKNVFWVDAKGRTDYGYFGDVVLFDTMYKKNEFKFPFVPFIGMNNHFQFVLLGCAFANESKSSYVWLIRAWIRSMHGQTPKVILTDQDPLLKEAIAEVLPEARHCFCLWHILSKIQEKLGYVIRRHENFVTKFCKCVLKSQTEAQFERRWWKLVERFDLKTDKWIESLYDDRLRWVPAFMKDIFLAGLSSTERLKSITSLLEKSLLRNTSLKEFLQQYNMMLQEKYDDEAKADFDTWHRQPGLKSPSPYGKQMAGIYTHAVFKKFQVEVLGVVACHPKIEIKDGPTTTFNVQDFEANQVHKVMWDESTSDTSCTCRLLEYNGFLCRHVMIVLQISGVNNIPEKYILKRWTKDAKNREEMKRMGPIESKSQCYVDLCQRACKLVDEGSLCQGTYTIALSAMEEALRKCESINNSVQNISGPTSSTNGGLKANKEGILSEKEKVHLQQEGTTTGVHCWDQMGYLNFRASAVDSSFGAGPLNLRVPTVGDASGNPEIVRIDQANTIESSSDDCCNNQAHDAHSHRLCLERLHQMGQLHFRSQNVQNYVQNQQFRIMER